MKKAKFISGLCLAILLSACSGEERPTASDVLQAAQSNYESGNYNVAKQLIDSIHTSYKQDVDVRRQAQKLEYAIGIDEEERNITFNDSLLAITVPQTESYRKLFIQSADTAYFDYKIYTHKLQTIGYRPRTNILCELKENGDMNVISVYNGAPFNHVAFRVSCGDVFMETDSVSLASPYNNRFDDLGSRWEYVTYTPELQNNIAGFVATYSNKPLKVTLKNNSAKKNSYTFFLTAADRQAIKESYEYSQLLKDIDNFTRSKEKSEKKIVWYQSKLELE